MMKSALLALALISFSYAAVAEEGAAPAPAEEGGEHAEKKPPAKPGLPTAEVLKLPVVAQWKKWEKENGAGSITVWGESKSTVEGQQCWGVALGESKYDGLHVWRHFCVPVEGGDIWVQKIAVHPEDDSVYLPYDKWVTECKPTVKTPGDC